MSRLACTVAVAVASVAVAVILCAGCGKRAEQSNPSGSGSPTPRTADAASAAPSDTMTDPIADENPTIPVVKAAFNGTPPAFPQLSKDGRTAAVELDTLVDLTGASTYAVAFVTTAGPTGTISLVDGKLAHVLLEATDPSKPPAIDRPGLARTAGTITKRLADEAFTPFERKIEELAVGEPNPAGPAKLQLSEADDGTLSLAVLDAAGEPLTKDTVKPVAMGKVADLECVSQPMPRHAWTDTARKRLLVEIGWNAGPDQCNAPDALYRLYVIP
jgi:hypothetical protein